METDFAGFNRDVERDVPEFDNAPDEGRAWQRRAVELARWVLTNMVVRADAHGKYYIDNHGRPRSCKQDGIVDELLLLGHFRSEHDGCQVGLYTTSLEDFCRWLLIDIDLHDGQPGDLAAKNLAFALVLY